MASNGTTSSPVIPLEEVRSFNISSYNIRPSDVDLMNLPFCKRYDLAQRQEMAARFRDAYPGRIGVVLHLAEAAVKELGKHLKDGQKPYVRIAVDPAAQMSELVFHARSMFASALPQQAGIFLYVCSKSVERIVSLNAKLSDYVDKCRSTDGIVHFMVTVEAVFGGDALQ